MDLLVPGPDERGGRMMFRLLLILYLGHGLPAVLGADSPFVAEIGGSVTLPCDGPADTETNKFLWLFEGKPACWLKNGSWCEARHYVNRTRLGSIQQNNFSLVINPVRKDDDGVYLCRISGADIRIIRLIVDGDGKPEDAVMPPAGGRKRRDTGTAGEECRSYREMEDPPGSETKDKQDSDENPPGASSGGNSVVIGVIVGLVVLLGAVAVAAVFGKRLWNRQRNKPSKRRPSEANLI